MIYLSLSTNDLTTCKQPAYKYNLIKFMPRLGIQSAPLVTLPLYAVIDGHGVRWDDPVLVSKIITSWPSRPLEAYPKLLAPGPCLGYLALTV